MRSIALIVAGIVLAGCTTVAPTAAVMPGPGKTLESFQYDKTVCEHDTDQQLAGAADTYNRNQIGTMVVATALGTGLGAAIGGGYGAGIGAASGAIAGTGLGLGGRDLDTLQRRYDIAYMQCMYLHGNRVPAI